MKIRKRVKTFVLLVRVFHVMAFGSLIFNLEG